MNKQEAIEAMKKGKRMTHSYFDPIEWMTMPNKKEIEFEDGCTMNANDFWFDRQGDGWETGYSIWNPVLS